MNEKKKVQKMFDYCAKCFKPVQSFLEHSSEAVMQINVEAATCALSVKKAVKQAAPQSSRGHPQRDKEILLEALQCKRCSTGQLL